MIMMGLLNLCPKILVNLSHTGSSWFYISSDVSSKLVLATTHNVVFLYTLKKLNYSTQQLVERSALDHLDADQAGIEMSPFE